MNKNLKRRLAARELIFAASAAVALFAGFGSANAAMPAIVQHNSIYTGTTASLAFPSNISANHILLVAITDGSSGTHILQVSDPTVTDSQGSTWKQISPNSWLSDVPNYENVWLYYAISTTSAADTITVTHGTTNSAPDLGFFINEISGVDTSNPIVATTTTSTSTASTAWYTSSLTDNAASSLLFAIGAEERATSTATAGVGYSIVDSQNSHFAVTEYQATTSQGSFNATLTSANTEHAMELVIFKGVSPSAPKGLIGKSLIGPSTLYSGLVGWWTFDGKNMRNNVADSSGQGNNGYLTGITSTSSAVTAGKIGQAISINGKNNYITVPSSASLQPANISVCAWARPSSFSGNWALVSKAQNGPVWGGPGYLSYLMRWDGSGVNKWEFDVGGSSNYSGSLSIWYDNTNTDNKWYFLCMTYDGAHISGYKNGVLLGTPASYSSAIAYNSSEPVLIGADYGGNPAAEYMPGKVDDVRIYNRALSQQEITELYDAGSGSYQSVSLVGPDDLNSGLVGWWTFDGKNMRNNVADSSGQGNNGYLTGITSTSSAVTAGKIGQAFSFKGIASAYINVPASASLNISGPISFSVWVKSFNTAGTQHIFFKGVGGTLNYAYILLNGLPYLELATVKNAVTPITNNVWHHIAVSFDGLLTTFYLDGAVDQILGQAAETTGLNPANIGASGTGSNPFNGIMDDLRVYNRALSQQDVTQLYNLGR